MPAGNGPNSCSKPSSSDYSAKCYGQLGLTAAGHKFRFRNHLLSLAVSSLKATVAVSYESRPPASSWDRRTKGASPQRMTGEI